MIYFPFIYNGREYKNLSAFCRGEGLPYSRTAARIRAGRGTSARGAQRRRHGRASVNHVDGQGGRRHVQLHVRAASFRAKCRGVDEAGCPATMPMRTRRPEECERCGVPRGGVSVAPQGRRRGRAADGRRIPEMAQGSAWRCALRAVARRRAPDGIIWYN